MPTGLLEQYPRPPSADLVRGRTPMTGASHAGPLCIARGLMGFAWVGFLATVALDVCTEGSLIFQH